jgi:hypothetical protein
MKTMISVKNLAIVTFSILASLSVHAQSVASDNTGNYSSWGMGSPNSGTQASQGTGFGSWTFINSTPNGGFSGEFPGGSYSDGGNNINSGNGNAFGMYANGANAAESQAIAPFSEGSIQAYQTFSVQFMADNIGDQGGEEGVDLQNSSSVNLFSVYFTGGSSDWYINVGGQQVDTGMGFTKEPLTFSFTQLAGDGWSFTISAQGGSSDTLTSTGTGDLLSANNISQADVFNLNGNDGGNQNDNSYFNNIQIVPEPSSMAVFAISGLGTLLAFRCRKS